MPDALGFDHAIGVITPSGNLVVERVTIALLRDLPAVSPHFSRIAVHGARDPFPDAYDLEGMLAAARLLAHAAPGAILWNGSKGFAIGIEHDRDLVRRVEDATGIPGFTSSLALVAALERIGARRIALVTPYTAAYQERLRARMAEAGLEVVADSHLGLSDNLSYASVPPARIAAQIRQAVASTRPEAVVTWCTNYAGALAVAEAEAETGIPVLDATVLPIWQALGRLEVDMAPAAPRWGRLFALG
jgi:maleate isomerase